MDLEEHPRKEFLLQVVQFSRIKDVASEAAFLRLFDDGLDAWRQTRRQQQGEEPTTAATACGRQQLAKSAAQVVGARRFVVRMMGKGTSPGAFDGSDRFETAEQDFAAIVGMLIVMMAFSG